MKQTTFSSALAAWAAVFLVLGAAQGEAAQRYFVKPDGNDANAGTSWGVAFQTLTKAAQTATHSGDEVWVAEGTYAENATVTIPAGVAFYGGFAGSETDLSQRDWAAHPAIIDGQNARRCVYNMGVLDGFDVARGSISDAGGGIYSKGIVIHCRIYENTAVSKSGLGGGVYNTGTLSECAIFNNVSLGSGGGIYNSGTANRCALYGNTAFMDGGGISNYQSIANCVVFLNTAYSTGGGIKNDGPAYNNPAKVFNCTVFGNISINNLGGGIYNNYLEGDTRNCIVWNNTGGDIYQGWSASHSCFSESAGTDGNIKIDPLFMNVSGDPGAWDFHLQRFSPCIDAGKADGAPADDFEGAARPMGLGFDMGAYEYLPAVTTPEITLTPSLSPSPSPSPTRTPGGPAMRYYVSPSGNDSNEGTSWGTAFKTLKKAAQMTLQSGGEVWVAEGTYRESSQVEVGQGSSFYGGFAGGETELSQRDWNAHRTIIDGRNDHRCALVWGVLDGFDVTKGYYDGVGGGVQSYGTVIHCRIYGNEGNIYYTSGQGGGICASAGSVTDCEIYDNEAGCGGGLYVSSGVTASNCVIYGNSSFALKSRGGGVEVAAGGVIAKCTIYNNATYNLGGGLSNYGSASQCAIYGNSTGADGGGVYNNGNLANCIIYNNAADENGGGVFNAYTSASSWGKMFNCTVCGNLASGGAGGGIHIAAGAKAANCISWNNTNEDIYGAVDASYCCFREATGANGNINADPKLLTTSGDPATWNFHLLADSPCIDTGTGEGAPDVDFDSAVRPLGVGFDMGAYEWDVSQPTPTPSVTPTPFLSPTISVTPTVSLTPSSTPTPSLTPLPARTPSGQALRFFVKPAGNDVNAGDSWDEAFRTLQRAAQAATQSGDVVWVAEGTYGEIATLEIPSGVVYYGGFAGGETDLAQRDWDAHPCIIDGGNLHRCVNNSGILDGFSITRGYCADQGGGVYNKGRIAHCKIYGNSVFAEKSNGGGVYLEAGVIEQSAIFINTSQSEGGGLYIKSTGKALHCEVYSNSTLASYGYGGGVYCFGQLSSCIVHDNSTYMVGGGVYLCYFARMENCIVYRNSARSLAGGILNESVVVNCTVFGNFANGEGGIRNADTMSPKRGIVLNTISWNNQNADFNNAFGIGIFNSCYDESDGTNGNFAQDPKFVNVSGDPSTWDFHLRDDSPCIDTGTAVKAPAADFEDMPRPLGAGFDMGAYEWRHASLPTLTPTLTPAPSPSPRPALRFFVRPSGSDSNLGTSWEKAFRTLDKAAKVAVTGDEFWVAQGTYPLDQTLTIPFHAKFYGGFAGGETDLSQRDWNAHPVIIDAQNARQCVINNGVLDGCRITGGNTSNNGGGVNSSGEVAHCEIYANHGYQGGGVYISRGLVTECTLNNNTASYGGGLYIGSADGEASRCEIRGNEASYGGGAEVDGGFLTNCRVFENSCLYKGGGIYSAGTIRDCLIFNNVSREYGAGLYNQGQAFNCAVFGNVLVEYSISKSGGGGIFNAGSNARLKGNAGNSTVFGNYAELGGGIYNDSGTLASNCIIFNNGIQDFYGAGISYSCFKEANGTNGNIFANPQFINDSGELDEWDFHLRGNSPCIDTGTAAGAPASDNEGALRPQGTGIDMGAYEWSDSRPTPTPSPTPTDPSGGTLEYVSRMALPGVARIVAASGGRVLVNMGTNGSKVVDVSNPAAPIAGAAIGNKDVVDVAVSGNTAYLVSGNYLTIYDVSNPQSAVIKSQHVAQSGIPWPEGSGGLTAYSVALSENLACLLSDNVTYIIVGKKAFPPIGNPVSHYRLEILDVSNTAAPARMGYCDMKGYLYYLGAGGNLVCGIGPNSSIETVNISNPSNPLPVTGSINAGGRAVAVASSGKLACVAADWHGLEIVDISNPAAPVIAGTYNSPGDARSVALSGHLAFVADGPLGLRAVDVSNPSVPVVKCTYDTPGTAMDVAFSDGYIYVADGDQGLCILRWTGPLDPTPTASPTTTPAPTATPEGWVPGDLSGDGRLDAEDTALAARALRGGIALTSEQSAHADANQDGVFDIADLIWMQAYLAAHYTNFP